jgi:ribosomal protein L34E
MKYYTKKESEHFRRNQSLQKCANCDHGLDGVCRKLDSDDYGKSTFNRCEFWYPPSQMPKIDREDIIIMMSESQEQT